MAAYVHPDVQDNGIQVIKDYTENLYICNAQPTTFTEASSTYKLGTKSAPTIGNPENATSGRKVVVSAISDGSVSATGTATWFALTDDSASKLLVAQALASSVSVTNGNLFTLTSLAINIKDPA